jgi:hypothetical protein
MSSRFSQGLKSLGADDAPPKRKETQQPRPVAVPEQPEAQDGQGGYMAPSRRGKKAVTGYFDPAVRQQLAVLAAEEQRSQNDLIAEALNMLFERYGKSPLA